MINLKDVITKYPECLESASKLRSYLCDLYPTEKRDITIISTIFDCGIADTIKLSNGRIDEMTVRSLCSRLENNYAFSPRFSKNCLLQWSKVFQTDADKEAQNSTLKITNKVIIGNLLEFGYITHEENKEKRPILWEILDIKSNRLLLISKFAITLSSFVENGIALWEICSLRKWLNKSFFESAFNEKDKDLIVATSVLTNKYFNTLQTKETKDRLFLLSIDEVKKYYKNPLKRICFDMPSLKKDEQKKELWWWLRSPCYDLYNASFVNAEGDIIDGGAFGNALGAVRPALWIEL